jgi:CHAD domain-containing protein
MRRLLACVAGGEMAGTAMARQPRGLVLSPDDPVGVAVRAVLRFHLRGFARNEGQARAGEVEPVHQLRVSTRRLRATLGLFAPVVPARFTGWARREVSWLGHAIGAVRDLDVLIQAVNERATRLAPELRGALGPVALVIHDQRASALAALVAVLDSTRCRRVLDRLAAFSESEVAGRRQPALGEIAVELIRPLERAVWQAGKRIDEHASADTMHRLRVRVKRLRYALETLRGLGGPALAKLLRRLEGMQDLLGEHQDAVTQIAWLVRYAETPGVPVQTLLGTGALINVLARGARKVRQRFPARWQRVSRRRLRTEVLEEIGARGRALRAAS